VQRLVPEAAETTPTHDGIGVETYFFIQKKEGEGGGGQ
jgi:hypothetical protein